MVRHSREGGNPPIQGIDFVELRSAPVAGQTRNDGEIAIKIFDLNGKCIYVAKPNSQFSIVNSPFIINLSHLPAGPYILQIHLDNQTIETIKIIVK